MSFVDNSQNSATAEQKAVTGSLQLPGLVQQLSPIEQIPFPEHTPPPVGGPPPVPEYSLSPGVTRPLTGPITGPGVTRHLPELETSSNITHNLPDLQTGQFPILGNPTTALRQPVVIRGTGKKSSGTMRPPKGRGWVVHLTVSIVLILITFGTLSAVLPAGSRDEHGGFNPFRSVANMFQSNGNNSTSLIAQQAATATVATQQDGCETCYNNPNPNPNPGNASGDDFTYGQCTYWADLRYHQLTGYWVPWSGNAGDWAYNATAYKGWIVSAQPHVPSIIVLAPGTQGAGGYGHVAIVESINADGSVNTSNWNWWANGGGWATWSMWTFRPGPGVSFIWHM